MSAPAAARCLTVRSAIAPLLLEPQISSVQISQQLAGASLEVLEERDEWLLVCGDDRYEGWVHRGYLHPEPEPGATPGERRISLGCIVQSPVGTRRALPLRAQLAPDEDVLDGTTVDAATLPSRFPLQPEAIVASAQRFFVGTSYQWGGVTPWGADCSGFAQAIFALHGLLLPRDAWQQAQAGEPTGTGLPESHAADLLFFSDRDDRKVTHVAIALGERRLAHCALGRGGFAVERLDAAGDGYVAVLRERFLFGRRVLQPATTRPRSERQAAAR